MAAPLDWRQLRQPAGLRVSPAATRAAPRPYRADALLYIVATIISTYVWRAQDIIEPLGKMKFPLLVALSGLGLYALDARRIRRARLVKSPILWLLIALAVIVAAGIPTSLLPGNSFDFLTKDFLPDLTMVLLVAATVRDIRDLEFLLRVHVGGALIYCTYVLLFFHMDDSGRLSSLVYYDANDLAQTIVCTLPIIMYLPRDKSRRWGRGLALCAIPVMLVDFIRAGSRGGFLGFLAIALIALIGYKPIRTWKRMLSLVVLLTAITAVGGDAFWGKMKTILSPKDDYNVQSESGRWQLWKNGLSIVRQRPYLGVGAREFPEANATLSDFARGRIAIDEGLPRWQPAHNSFVSIAAETGVGGFLVFISLLITALVTAIRFTRDGQKVRATKQLAALSRALAISLVGYIVSAFFLTSEYQAVLYLDLGFLLGARKLMLQLGVAR